MKTWETVHRNSFFLVTVIRLSVVGTLSLGMMILMMIISKVTEPTWQVLLQQMKTVSV